VPSNDARYHADAVTRLQQGTLFHVGLSEDMAFLRRVRAVAAERIAELQQRTTELPHPALPLDEVAS
jgi:hypothetical protein